MNYLTEFALNSLLSYHYKHILYVDMTSDSILSVWNNPRYNPVNLDMSASDFFADVLTSPDIKFSSNSDIQKYTQSEECYKALTEFTSVTFRYKHRLESLEWQWMEIEIHKGPEFSNTNICFLIYIKEMSSCYQEDLHRLSLMKTQSTTDTLTGLHNRAAFEGAVTSLNSGTVGIIYMDLNCLKSINDESGHLAGDQYIKLFSAHLTEIICKEHCYRIGGDEFIAIIPGVSDEEFRASVEKLLECNMSQLSVPFAAIGYEWGDLEMHPFKQLLENAESLMYTHKKILKKRYNFDR